jgi:hypothetical protein
MDVPKVPRPQSFQELTLTELIVAKERVKSEIYAVLTPEQQDKPKRSLQPWSRACSTWRRKWVSKK